MMRLVVISQFKTPTVSLKQSDLWLHLADTAVAASNAPEQVLIALQKIYK